MGADSAPHCSSRDARTPHLAEVRVVGSGRQKRTSSSRGGAWRRRSRCRARNNARSRQIEPRSPRGCRSARGHAGRATEASRAHRARDEHRVRARGRAPCPAAKRGRGARLAATSPAARPPTRSRSRSASPPSGCTRASTCSASAPAARRRPRSRRLRRSVRASRRAPARATWVSLDLSHLAFDAGAAGRVAAAVPPGRRLQIGAEEAANTDACSTSHSAPPARATPSRRRCRPTCRARPSTPTASPPPASPSGS